MSGPVVIGVEWSAAGQTALQWAGYLATTWDNYLVPVTVLDRSLARAADQPHDPVRRAWLADLHNWSMSAGRNVRLRPKVRAGRPASQLLVVVEQQAAGALVVGRDGSGAGRDGPTSGPGSVTFRVAHQASVPLVVVPAVAPRPPVRRIVVGDDGTVAASGALAWASSLAATTGADLTIVHVTASSPRCTYESAVAQSAGARTTEPVKIGAVGSRIHPLPCSGGSDHPGHIAATGADIHLIDGGRPAEALLRVAQEQGAELVVVGRRGARSVGRQHLGAVASDLLHESDRALAIIPAD